MSAEPIDPLDQFRDWDPKVQAEVARRIEENLKSPPQVWYCKKGRTCDGDPHDGYDYQHARGDQWPPPGTDWLTWLMKGGRGSGKTRGGSEWTRKRTQTTRRFALIGPTVAHVREVMVEGESGIINVFARFGQKVLWEPSKRRITLPTGCIISTYSGEEPDRLRGPEHEASWLDEPSHMPLIAEVWDNLLMGLRIGERPQILCTTTPLPTKWTKELIAEDDTVTVTVSTYVNLKNLTPTFRKKVLNKYEGTRLGRQELHGEILEDVEGALWTWDDIENNRVNGVTPEEIAKQMERVVVSVDPTGTDSVRRDEVGLVVIGKLGRDFYVIYDASGRYSPNAWAKRAVSLAEEFGADCIVAERNYGGLMVSNTIENVNDFIKVKLVWSRRGKELRAEPVVGKYEQARVHHVGRLEELEDQQTTWVPGKGSSPDRVDALVHGITELGEDVGETSIAIPSGSMNGPTGTRPTSQFPSIFDRPSGFTPIPSRL
jgi:phage terminase large subunit-like protein